MRLTPLPVALLLGAVLGSAPLSSQPSDILGLHQAVGLALEHNRSVENAALEVEKSDRRFSAARTHYRPTFGVYGFGSVLLTPLDFEFTRGVFGDYEATGPIPAENTSISTDAGETIAVVVGSLSQPLSQLHRIGLGVRAAKLGREIARERLRAERQAVVNEVKSTYYSVLQTESNLKAKTDAVEFYRELDRVVADFVREQLALEAETLEVKARLARGEYEILSLGHRLLGLKENLNLLMGRDIRLDFEVDSSAEPRVEALGLEVARSRALAQRPQVREARLREEQAQLEWRLKKSEAIPDVSFRLDYLSTFNIDLLPNNVVQAGFLLNWEPFDWRRRKQELGERDRSIKQARNGLEEAESRILIEVGDRFRRLEEARALRVVSEASREARREWRRVVNDRYGQQQALLRDVLEAQAELSEAEDEWQRSVLESWTAAADFERAIGEER